MKLLKSTFGLLALLTVVVMSSCSNADSDPDPVNNLAGTWTLTTATQAGTALTVVEDETVFFGDADYTFASHNPANLPSTPYRGTQASGDYTQTTSSITFNGASSGSSVINYTLTDSNSTLTITYNDADKTGQAFEFIYKK